MQDYKDRVYRYEASRRALSTRRTAKNRQTETDFTESFMQRVKLFCIACCVLFMSYLYIRVQVKYEKDSVFYEIAQVFRKRGDGSSGKTVDSSPVKGEITTKDIYYGEKSATAEIGAREQKFFLTRLEGKKNRVVLVPVMRKIEAEEKDFYRSLLQYLVEVKVPGLINAINPGVKILEARLENEVLIVDVNQQFEFNRYGMAGMRAQIQQILWTILESSQAKKENIQAISFLIEGERKTTIGSDGEVLAPFYSSRHLRRSIMSRESQKS